MTEYASFRISLNITHPTMSAEDIVAILGLNQRYSYSVGKPRISKNGTPLGGVYKATSLSFKLHEDPINENENSLCNVVSTWITSISEKKYFSRISDSGGDVYFLLGLYSEENMMFEFKPNWMAELVKNRIGLKLDFYGGPETV